MLSHVSDAAPQKPRVSADRPLDRRVEAARRELEACIEGDVCFDDAARALYATDASNYRYPPLGVVLPKHAADVEAAFAICRRYELPITGRGGGTSVAGQTCNTSVILDYSRYMQKILALDPEGRTATVEPGIVLDDLRHAAERHGLTFGPDPATHNRCTLGGMLGNNSCGVHSVMAGRTVDNVEALEVLTHAGQRFWVGRTTPDELTRIIAEGGERGRIYQEMQRLSHEYAAQIRARFPHIPRRVSGFGLDELLPENGFNVARALVGTEGTCVAILAAKLRLVPSPRCRVLLVLGYKDVYRSGDHVVEILRFGPIGLEGMDQELIDDEKRRHLNRAGLKLLPKGGGWLLVEFGGDTVAEAEAKAKKAQDAVSRGDDAPDAALFTDKEQQHLLWQVREAGLGATAHPEQGPDTWEGWEDSAVPPAKVGAYLRDLRALYDRYGYKSTLYGHFGDGCIHCRITFDLVTEPGRQKYRRFLTDAAKLVVSYGGSISGEHGDGQSKAELLGIMYGDDLLQAFRSFKLAWDPENRMNPGRVVDPNPILSHLRMAEYDPKPVKTYFAYEGDHFSFGRAMTRCVGVGECRREEGGTMCPSYKVTREEMHSTRGRAHMLFEMLQGETVKKGWRDNAVKESLDLCLSCKGCKSDCPVHVDMATYKSEFMAHYYKGRVRPPAAYAMGLITWWSRLASGMPGLVNAATHAPGLQTLIKTLGGIAPERQMPTFAHQTFKHWFKTRHVARRGGDKVILWPDTFTNHFHPEIGQAAVAVLEAAGCEVILPRGRLCCGRPLYDFGMLGMARTWLTRIVDTLADEITEGVPIVALEPSCASVFRDELKEMLPRDKSAKKLSSQVLLLSEFLADRKGYEPPKLAMAAVMHGHCHQKSVMGMSADEELLKRMGVQLETLDSGCCGMAGSFGFERGKYGVSVQCGEQVLLPAVRAAEAETLVVASGFSCREQIRQLTKRHGLHLAEVLEMALERELASGRDSERQGGDDANAYWT